MRPCQQNSNVHPDQNAADVMLPCYEVAAKSSPNNQQIQYDLAGNLAMTGHYNDAKPIYEKLSQSGGPFSSDARKMLLPGSMQKLREISEQGHRNWQARLALTVENNAEEADFLRLHAIVRRGRIVRMSPEDKAVWLAMRDRHQKETDALIGYRKQ